jgi:hypothetical protein
MLNVCRLSSVMATAITMSGAVAHLMELPAKMHYEPPLYVRRGWRDGNPLVHLD